MATRQNTLLIKRSNVIDKIPPISGLTIGELALNTADAKLYTIFTSGTTGATEVREIGWDRINRTGDTVTGDFNFFGDLQINGASLPNGYALSVTGDTNLNGDLYVNGDLFYSGSVVVTGSTIIENGLTANTIYTDYIDFNTGATVTQSPGRISWDSGTGTLNVAVGDSDTGLIDLQVGQEEIVRVFNSEATTLLKGEIVYVSGSQGNRPAVKRALAISDGYSVTTLGMVDIDIDSGDEGYVTTFGIISNLNTSGLTGGTPVFLSPTVAGGYTSIKPQAPEHIVLIGYVVRVSATVGSIFINISNGWEIDELHDVRITSPTQGDLLVRSSYSGTPVWVNTKTLPGNYTISGNTSHIGNFNITGNTNQIGNFTITGNTSQEGIYYHSGDTFVTGNTTQIGDITQIGNFNITGNTTQYGNTYISGTSLSGQCAFEVDGNVCIDGDLLISGDTFMSGDFCMNNMNSTGATGTNCFDTSLIPTGTTVIHQFQGEGGILAHLGDLATGEPNSKGYIYMENNVTSTTIPANTTAFVKVNGTTTTIPTYNNLFTTGSSSNELVYDYPPATGTTLTYIKYNISYTASLGVSQNKQITFQLFKLPYPYTGSTEPIPASMTNYVSGSNASTGSLTGIVTAQHLDSFTLYVTHTSNTTNTTNVTVSDLTISLFT